MHDGKYFDFAFDSCKISPLETDVGELARIAYHTYWKPEMNCGSRCQLNF